MPGSTLTRSWQMYAGVVILDGNRIRLCVSDWKVLLAIKTLRARLREIMTRSFRNPGKALSTQHLRWLDLWQNIFTCVVKDKT